MIKMFAVLSASVCLAPGALAQLSPTAQNRTITGESFSTVGGQTDHQGPFEVSAPAGDFGPWDGLLVIPGFISGMADQQGGFIAPDRIVLDSFTMSLGGGNGPGTSARTLQSNQFGMTFDVDAASTYTLDTNFACAGPGGPPDTSVTYSVVLTLTGPGGGVFRYETGADNGYSVNVSGATGDLAPGSYTLSLVGNGDVSFVAPPGGAGNGAGGGAGGASPILTFVVTAAGEECIADFNHSGGTPDDADVAAFFLAWNNGDDSADVNRSGGTPDDADIAYFFVRWNSGC